MIANMDEDMRTAMEILISECSCYTPFKPFLMELVATNDLFMPNKLEFLSEVVLHGRDEHKAYANNEYGLVEYTLKPFEIDINYKNKNGERVTATTGYRELYEVLSYMVKVPHYCGEDHLNWYKDMIAGSRGNMAPVYVSFLENRGKSGQTGKPPDRGLPLMAGRLRIAILMNQQTQKRSKSK